MVIFLAHPSIHHAQEDHRKWFCIQYKHTQSSFSCFLALTPLTPFVLWNNIVCHAALSVSLLPVCARQTGFQQVKVIHGMWLKPGGKGNGRVVNKPQ